MLGQSQSHETTLTWVMKFSFTLVYNVLCFTRYTCKLQPFFSDVHVRPKFSFARPRWCLGRKYSVCPFKRKKLFAALHKHWNTFNNTVTHCTCILSQTFDANRAESCLCLKASSSYSTSLNIRKIKKIKT